MSTSLDLPPWLKAKGIKSLDQLRNISQIVIAKDNKDWDDKVQKELAQNDRGQQPRRVGQVHPPRIIHY